MFRVDSAGYFTLSYARCRPRVGRSLANRRSLIADISARYVGGRERQQLGVFC